MAGQKKKQEDLRVLGSIPIEHIVTMFEAGKSQTRICKDLGIGRRALEIWCDAPENEHKIARARARAADNLACETLEIADAAAPEESNVARVRIQTRQWIAERWKPSVYAQQRGPSVSISIGGLRLDALRHVEVVQDEVNIPQISG
jgi:hypothetical protein